VYYPETRLGRKRIGQWQNKLRLDAAVFIPASHNANIESRRILAGQLKGVLGIAGAGFSNEEKALVSDVQGDWGRH
jgi:hypothetical protein